MSFKFASNDLKLTSAEVVTDCIALITVKLSVIHVQFLCHYTQTGGHSLAMHFIFLFP